MSDRNSARILLGLLEEYVQSCHNWEDYIHKAASGAFKSQKEDKDEHRRHQTEHSLPLMQKCLDKGFKYVDLMVIIPPPSRTTYEQRDAIFEDVKSWAEKEYGFQFRAN